MKYRIVDFLEWLDGLLDKLPVYYEKKWHRNGDWGCRTVGRLWIRLYKRWDLAPEQVFVSRFWTEDWNSPEDTLYNDYEEI
jgi:hypothetical protein